MRYIMLPAAVFALAAYMVSQVCEIVKQLNEDEDSTISALLGVVRPADEN